MNELSNLIKKISKKCIEAYKPADTFIATITKTDPIEAEIDAQRPIYSDTLLCSKQVKENGLAVGDRVIILQDAGANMYYIIGVVA